MGVNVMTRMLQVPRSRGAVSGLLLVLLGLWGALIPLVGPYFHYAYTPDTAWTFTAGRTWLEIVPGVATILGGIILLASASRPVAMVGAWLAAVAGAWFALGTVLSPIWPAASTLNPGSPVGTTTLMRQLEHLGFFTGLGVVIVFVAALALGRLMVVGVRDRELALGREAAAAEPDSLSGDTTTVGTTTTASTNRPGRGSLHSFGRWLVARRS
jgi:Fe2+ transport system protein FeoA